jgi:hypothetical protein
MKVLQIAEKEQSISSGSSTLDEGWPDTVSELSPCKSAFEMLDSCLGDVETQRYPPRNSGART